MKNNSPVSLVLTERGIPHEEFQHEHAPNSLEQAAEERSQRPEQIVRSILFRCARGEYVMVLIAGPQQIDWKSLRQYVGRSRITMASKEEVLSVTGFELGAVAPFGLPRPLRVLVDMSVFGEEEISMGSGARGVAVMLKSTDLMKALGDVEIVNLSG
ncbi:MAG: YbaK/EbsC family protein [Anaerolineales bacterium]|nr:YbaK/EbsC family protein [Chloroflexota bacterium]MBL6983428.1 YbaK/EbsC family protein [Anaerolineales bacterium]